MRTGNLNLSRALGTMTAHRICRKINEAISKMEEI